MVRLDCQLVYLCFLGALSTFRGKITSENAVRAQVWIAISVYVLVAIIKKRLALKPSLYTILQIFSVNIFEKTPVVQLLMENNETVIQFDNDKQLGLFNL